MPQKKSDPIKLRQLTKVFRKYGAEDPEAWARSQLEEGIPQLAIFSFAKAMWAGVVDENDHTWIDKAIAETQDRPHGPCSGIGAALTEMLAKGVSREAITNLARVVQYEALFHAAALIDGSIEED